MFKPLADAIKILATTNAKIELITNGELLTLKKVDKLFEAGLDVINISVYGTNTNTTTTLYNGKSQCSAT